LDKFNLHNILKNHPRAESLTIREKLVKGFKKGIVATAGLIAHGRGECFDYLLGEKTQPFAFEAEKVAVATLLLSSNPVISVNGNTAALCAREVVKLSKLVNAKVEVNLFYRSLKREKLIAKTLRRYGLSKVLGVGGKADKTIPSISSLRCKVDSEGIFSADTVLLAIEDGDRTSALRKAGKRVIAIDLNPFSRTAIWASITIVDNLVRALPNMIRFAEALRKKDRKDLEGIVESYNNDNMLKEAVRFINLRLKNLCKEKVFGWSICGEEFQRMFLEKEALSR